MADDISECILNYLKDKCPANSLEIAAYLGEDHQRVVGGIKSLQAIGSVIEAQQITSKKLELTEEGQCVAETGSHESHIFNAVPEHGIAFTDLVEQVPNGKVGFNKAMSFGWIKADKQDNGIWVTRNTEYIVDTLQEYLQHILNNSLHLVNAKAIQDLRKRKLVQEVTVKSYEVTRGPDFTTSVEKAEADLMAEMILSGVWKNKNFKSYNLDALGSPSSCGHLHPLLQVRSEFRQIFLEMGFTEMPTNNFVENSFWNFDALFQPQQHPARDAHDTFFLSDPKSSSNLPPSYFEKVKQVHSIGGYGSQGYNYDWRREEAEKNLLRTHTTAASARMLYQVAKEEKFHPVKFFSIDRVFRNETLDATHLAEFHQVEGLIADYTLTLGNLIGVLYQFFSKLGITQLQFKPAYNPYTEPSMEIFCYHMGLEKWIEVGNSGVFRPEMLLPMGLPEDVTIIAWGLSLERPTMIKYGIKNIRDLVGPRVNLQMVYDSPLCRLEKTSKRIHEETSEEKLADEMDKRWKSVMDKLHAIYCDLKKLKNMVTAIENATENALGERYSFVIMANPLYPPYSACLILQIIVNSLPITLTVSAHSSVKCLPHNLKSLFPEKISNDDDCIWKVHLIWKEMEHNPHLILSPIKYTCIIGEVNIARFLLRIIESKLSVSKIVYESRDMNFQVSVDVWLDNMQKVLQEKDKKPNAFLKKVNSSLANKNWLIDSEIISLADILLWSLIKRLNCGKEFAYISTWYQKACHHEIFCSSYCKVKT